MTYFKGKEIRKAFLDFFKSKNHEVLPSASLVPYDDPSLLWINSGVATLKPYFDGRQTPPSLRMTNSQKAIRTNDIENVGNTARHHTFFEMLGNFSIGDYFKEDAIIWAWEFLTSATWLKLNPQLLYITVFNEDEEAYRIWREVVKVADDHIIKGSRKTNFWDMGQGPCGPNSEIYYDRGLKYDLQAQGIKLLIEDLENDRYVEIWNIVFSEFNNDGHNNYLELPRKNIDTGAGLERITAIVQDVPTNFDTDLFQDIIHEIEKFTPLRYEINNYFHKDLSQAAVNKAFKIISDHVRTITFAISDGVYPGNKDRGYVLRRLIRRSVVCGLKLDINRPFLSQIVTSVIKVMQDFYPYLISTQKLVEEILFQEEDKFFTTLKNGRDILLKYLQTHQEVSGDMAFKMFDTYGYPLDLTIEIALENGKKVDQVGFDNCLLAQKDLARSSRKDFEGMKIQSLSQDFEVPTIFKGYDTEKIPQAKIVALLKQGHKVDHLSDENGVVVLEATPFYAEKGGQAADSGTISGANGIGVINDVQVLANKQIHHFISLQGKINTTDVVCAEVNHEYRRLAMKSHSGTHLLHAALRMVLGNHVMQAGSFNNYQYLRMDFSHFQALSIQEINTIESQVKTWIQGSYPCEVIYTNYENALKIDALSFFGEKYDEEVRVVKFGNFSIELCGGTHCHNSADVEDLLVMGVESKGSGVYRIQALTSHETINQYIEEKIDELSKTLQAINDKYIKSRAICLSQEWEDFYQLNSKLSPNRDNFRKIYELEQHANGIFRAWSHRLQEIVSLQEEERYRHLPIIEVGNVVLVIKEFNNVNILTLKNLIEYYRKLHQNLICIFLNDIGADNKVIITAISAELTNVYSAKMLLSSLLKDYTGTGGGSNLFAQGKIRSDFNDKIAIEIIKKEIK